MRRKRRTKEREEGKKYKWKRNLEGITRGGRMEGGGKGMNE